MSPDRSRSDLRLVRPGDDHDPNQRSAFDRSALTGLVDAAFDDDAQSPTKFHAVPPSECGEREPVILQPEVFESYQRALSLTIPGFGASLTAVAAMAQTGLVPKWAKNAGLLTGSENDFDNRLRCELNQWAGYLENFPPCEFLSERSGEVLLISSDDADLTKNPDGADQVINLRNALSERVSELESSLSAELNTLLQNPNLASFYAGQLVDVFLLSFRYSLASGVTHTAVSAGLSTPASPYVAIDKLNEVLPASWAVIFAEIEKSMNETPVVEPSALGKASESLRNFFSQVVGVLTKD